MDQMRRYHRYHDGEDKYRAHDYIREGSEEPGEYEGERENSVNS